MHKKYNNIRKVNCKVLHTKMELGTYFLNPIFVYKCETIFYFISEVDTGFIKIRISLAAYVLI